MNLSAGERFTVADAREIYGTERWGNGYFTVLRNGHLGVVPQGEGGASIDVAAVVEGLRARGLSTPMLLRFPQILESQVRRLTGAFAHARKEFGYRGRYRPVYPIKVNQTSSVVRHLLGADDDTPLGLEVGSRPELLAALGVEAPEGSLILCNGFKDDAYLEAAAHARDLDRPAIVVIEKPFELDAVLARAARGEAVPDLGIRLRLRARGSGMWEKSGGFASKFGLSTLHLLQAIDRLRAAGLENRLQLLHFHIGSQITEIRRIKNAVLEATRIYAKLCKRGTQVRYLDVGGGLGIDYDGSRTSSDASVNYGVQEYANDVVFGIQEVCEEENVPEPDVISESGRMLVGYHSLLIVDVRARVSAGADDDVLPPTGDEARVVQDLVDVERNIHVKNYREFYHDAVAYRDQMQQQFRLGMIGIEDRAKAEHLFWKIARKAVAFSKTARFVGDEFVRLEARLRDKYVCNFSVFQSLPDHWALDQLFPVMPTTHLNEAPTVRASLADITCDSDGEVELFVDLRSIKTWLEVHEPRPGRPYDLAFAMIGAYQDTMGDQHNLLGRVHEAEVRTGDDGALCTPVVRRGETARDALAAFGYDSDALLERISHRLRESIEAGRLSPEAAAARLESYRASFDRYTYLES